MFEVSYDGKLGSAALKQVFPKVMEELLNQDERVVYLDADLMNSIGMGGFDKTYPGRAVDMGVQEANMVGVAAGMSAEGKIPYIHSFAPFVSRRVYDQVFLSVAYAGNNVRIIGSDPGVTAAYNGGTHMPFEDIALYRAIPGAVIFDICDAVQLEQALRMTKDRYGLTYIRTPRKQMKTVYGENSRFEIGKGCVLADGEDAVIIASGIMTAEALEASGRLKDLGISAAVIDPVTIKPLDEPLIISYAGKTKAVVTAENANVNGGLGDAVASVLSVNEPVILRKVGIQDEFGEVGTEEYLRERYRLTPEEIVKQVMEAVGKKRERV